MRHYLAAESARGMPKEKFSLSHTIQLRHQSDAEIEMLID